MPYSFLESIIEQSEESCYVALCQTQRTIRRETPDWPPWLLYFLRTLQQHEGRLETEIGLKRLLMTRVPDLSLRMK